MKKFNPPSRTRLRKVYGLLARITVTNRFPQIVSSTDEVDLVRSYFAAGLVEAHFAPDIPGLPTSWACVTGITAAGREAAAQISAHGRK
ncbi:hypothetical protein [Xylophilus sp. GOD-11R]|uniref:hypothetical protein n=1 Tax=Xylophilus sp. GOD-11R TaxID=3089814 RepID=UPI00298BF743|nr:hypothetical protein [Xylophilus sp. GOD-11R]WPB58665.1 hypothetical protein R9X41_08515 [Xylophilus sp. GOD-11R]